LKLALQRILESANAWSISIPASAASRRRQAGSFCRQRRNNEWTLCGVRCGNIFQSGSDFRTLLKMSGTVSPPNVGFAVSISYSTQPNAKISVRRSTCRPLICSGDMYAAVPRMAPGKEALISVGELDNVV